MIGYHEGESHHILNRCLFRDLPQFGHKSWQTQFGKTFDVYTKVKQIAKLDVRNKLDGVHG